MLGSILVSSFFLTPIYTIGKQNQSILPSLNSDTSFSHASCHQPDSFRPRLLKFWSLNFLFTLHFKARLHFFKILASTKKYLVTFITKYSCPSVSMGDWFQDLLWIPTSTEDQVLQSSLRTPWTLKISPPCLQAPHPSNTVYFSPTVG